MKKLTNKEIKELEKALNNKEQWAIDNGTYLYSLNCKKDSVILKVYDSEINEDYLQFTYTVSKEENMYNLIKSIINKLYEEEINYKQSYTRKTQAFYRRKIKSLSLWQDRNKQDRVDKIVSELTERYDVNKRFEYEIGTFREIIKDAYRAMNVLCKDWRCNDIRDRLLQRCGQLNIHNVGCSHVGSVVTAYRHDDNSNIIAKSEYLVEDDYCNINEAIQIMIRQLNRKVA